LFCVDHRHDRAVIDGEDQRDNVRTAIGTGGGEIAGPSRYESMECFRLVQ